MGSKDPTHLAGQLPPDALTPISSSSPPNGPRMHRVSGLVLVLETQAPVPNLQVVLYDLDPREPRPDLAALNTAKAPNQSAPPFWQQIPGERIGSVLTGPGGEFAIEFDPRDFAAPDGEPRPDLLLLVLAPEDAVAETGGIPVPLSPQERILHCSYDVVVDAGRQEAYVVRLPKARLDGLRIPYPSGVPVRTTRSDVTRQLSTTVSLRTGVRTALATQLREKAKPAIDLKKKADQAFTRFTLSSVPDALRKQPTYLNPGEDLRSKQTQLVGQSLKSIPEADRSAGVIRKLRLALPRPKAEALGLKEGPDGSVQGEVSIQRVMRAVSPGPASGSLEFRNALLGTCRAEREAERLIREALDRCGGTGTGGTEVPGAPSVEPDPDGEPAAFVREYVDRQMRHVTPPEVELAYGVERNGEITATITRPGPADVTAYHDFHELQIALEHIWAEAFDASLVDLVQTAYAEVVRYANQVSGVPESVVKSINEPVRTVDDMRRLYSEIRRLQTIIEDQDRGEERTSQAQPLTYSVKRIVPDITMEDWTGMTEDERNYLLMLAAGYDELDRLSDWDKMVRNAPATFRQIERDAAAALQRARARRRAEARPPGAVSESPPSPASAPPSRLDELMAELDRRMSERYRFDIFAPNSVNYGILLTYRQAWTPKEYQVGDLVSTIPLAPKEVRRYTKKRVVRKSRTQKELEEAQGSRRSESSSTARADAEIVKRASNKTSFEQTAEGTLSVGVFDGKFGTRFGIDAETASSNTKKNFREAVLKAAEEYREQRRLEVETSISEEVEVTDSGEISNPNDEITVTYLFYELQRQYEVHERIHRLTPVILVANEVPRPDEIDEDWLIAHHWILRRVILDDSFLPALEYLTTSAAGDEMALEIMWTNLQRQARLVDEAAAHLEQKSRLARDAFEELRRLTGMIRDPDQVQRFADVNLAAAFGPFALIGLLGGDDGAAEKREEVAKLAIERADREQQEATASLSREVTALQKAVDQYSAALREHLDRQAAIAALRMHVKDNILWYMQAIWDHENSDQRYFRLYNVEVPWVVADEFTVRLSGPGGSGGRSDWVGVPSGWVRLEGEISLTAGRAVTRKLAEVADLDTLLGYKGNYMIFPVKEPNHLHWYMMQDYIDPATGGLRDPDEFGNYTTEEILDYICCLRESGVDETDERMRAARDLLRERIASGRSEKSLVVVPTDSLYIEALPGKHPILEDFKLVHRAVDVKKAQAELRRDELENVRLAARLLADEREDPDIERKIVIEGARDVIVPPEA